MIADYHKGQSLIETLFTNGLDRVFLTDWKSATEDMKDLGIDEYLAEINAVVDDLGGRVNLIGLCQGGWMSAMYAARFPHKIATLVLAGAPIDTDAGDGPIKHIARQYPTSFYEGLVAMGGGLMRGKFMLLGWKGMHPAQHYIQEYIDLYEHIDDPVYLRKEETFASWYENPIDLPGRFYLQTIVQLFKENRLAKGMCVGLGRHLELKNITCPAYLLCRQLRRHHHNGTGLGRRKISGHAKEHDRESGHPGRSRGSLHGVPKPQGHLASNRAMDRQPLRYSGTNLAIPTQPTAKNNAAACDQNCRHLTFSDSAAAVVVCCTTFRVASAA